MISRSLAWWWSPDPGKQRPRFRRSFGSEPWKRPTTPLSKDVFPGRSTKHASGTIFLKGRLQALPTTPRRTRRRRPWWRLGCSHAASKSLWWNCGPQRAGDISSGCSWDRENVRSWVIGCMAAVCPSPAASPCIQACCGSTTLPLGSGSVFAPHGPSLGNRLLAGLFCPIWPHFLERRVG